MARHGFVLIEAADPDGLSGLASTAGHQQRRANRWTLSPAVRPGTDSWQIHERIEDDQKNNQNHWWWRAEGHRDPLHIFHGRDCGVSCEFAKSRCEIC